MKNRGQGSTAERRSLVEGVKPAIVADRKAEAEFVFAAKAKMDQPAPTQTTPSPSTESRDPKGQGSVSRAPIHHTACGPILRTAANGPRWNANSISSSRIPSRTFWKRQLEPWLRLQRLPKVTDRGGAATLPSIADDFV